MPFIEGYCDPLSAVPGQTIRLHVSTDMTHASLRIVREGWPERVVTEDTPPPAAEPWANGAGWPVAHEFTVPHDWTSGVYRLELKANTPRDRSQFDRWSYVTADHAVLLVVRAARPASTSSILLQLSTNTYAAYNNWGGKSTYAYNSSDNIQSPRASLLRPGHGYHGTCFPIWERAFVQWAEREGYVLEYAINDDLDTWPAGFDGYRLILSVGHDEYWSRGMRDNLERFIANGGNAAFFSGNSVCWQVRYEDNRRTMVTYKEYPERDPAYAAKDFANLTTLWSHPLINRPENHLTGVGFPMGGYHRSHDAYMDGSGAYTVRRVDHWVFENTGLREGDEFGGAQTIVGYECDGCEFTEVNGKPVPTHKDGTPKTFIILAQAPAVWTGCVFPVHHEAKVSPDGRATLGAWTSPKGSTVFTAGTTDWSHALGHDATVNQITHNVLRKLMR
ncbi:MAG: hypothetical protein K8S99_04350 [Planctomycetes bacterium]|nr:hypothetical protein [Planctomycetota bacterium]